MTTDPLSHESERVDALHRYNILDTDPDPEYDEVAIMVARLCGCRFAAISFVDDQRCWFKSSHGYGFDQQARSGWFCAHTVRRPDDVTIVRDALADSSLTDFELVRSGPCLRFYAGAPITSTDGFVLGALCVMDSEPKDIDREQCEALSLFARQISSLLELRRTSGLLEIATIRMQMLVDRDPVTGLPSERMFRSQLRSEFQYARRHCQALSLVLLDIDDFGKYGEKHGADRADELLKRVARMVNRDTRDYDLVARSHEDEFAIVMRNATEAVGLSVAHRLQTRVSSPELSKERISISLGVSSITPDMISSKEMVDRARRSVQDWRSTAHSRSGRSARAA